MYYALTDVQFWLYAAITLVALIVSCYFPGWLVVRKVHLESKLSEFVVSIVSGLSFLALQGHIFGYFTVRYLTYVYLLVTCLLIWKYRTDLITTLRGLWSEIKMVPIVVWVAIIVSVTVQLYSHVFSGLASENGVGFYFVNSVDGVMHLSYIQSMVHHLPPTEPGFAGKALENYHYWGDLVMAEFARIWYVPVIHLFFHYIPTILILLTSLLILQIIKALKGNTTAAILALFLFTFGSDASFIFSQYFNHTWGDAVAALDTGPSFIFNMPQVFSRVILLAVFCLIFHWNHTKKDTVWLLISLLGASLFNFKVYYGIYFALGFGFLCLYLCFVHFKKNWDQNNSLITVFHTFIQKNFFLFVSFGIFVIVTAFTFLPHNSGSGGLFWEPLAWSKKFLSVENFNYQDWFFRMQVYEESGNIRNRVIYNMVAIFITLLSVYGIRLLGLWPMGKSSKYFSPEIVVFIIPVNIIFIAVGFLFLQTTGVFNIYNFLITPIVSFNIIAAISIASIKNQVSKAAIILALILVSLPRTYLQLAEYFARYYSQRPDYLVSHSELELFEQLRRMEPGIVQADPGNSYEGNTPYVSFFSNQQTYLGGKYLIKMNNDMISEREETVSKVFDSTTSEELSRNMKDARIQYLYVSSPEYLQKFRQVLVNSESVGIVIENEHGMILSRI